MTKQEAREMFVENVLPGVISIYGKDDETAIRTEWNDWTDYLCKDGQITDKQYEAWEVPDFCETELETARITVRTRR